MRRNIAPIPSGRDRSDHFLVQSAQRSRIVVVDHPALSCVIDATNPFRKDSELANKSISISSTRIPKPSSMLFRNVEQLLSDRTITPTVLRSRLPTRVRLTRESAASGTQLRILMVRFDRWTHPWPAISVGVLRSRSGTLPTIPVAQMPNVTGSSALNLRAL